MQIGKHSVVAFHYQLRDDSGELLESSEGGDPSLYLHGANNIIKGLEAALDGKSAGDHVEVTLPPEQAYGPYQPDRQQRMPAKYLKHEGRLHPGKAVRFNTDQGMRHATVVKVGKFSVDVDLNHPLAGKTLSFAVDVVDVRAATPEEIEHGHAHGPGGHQHD